VEKTSFSASTPCVSTHGIGTSCRSNVGTTPSPSSPDALSSAATTASMLVQERSISSRTPCPSTYDIQTSSLGINHMSSLNPFTDVPAYSSSSTVIPFMSTQMSHGTVSDVMSYTTTHSAVDLTAMFTSTTRPSTDLTDVSSSHKTTFALRHMMSGSVTDVSISAHSAEAEVTATLSFQLSEFSDTFSVSSNLTASTHSYIAQSSTDDYDVTSPCCLADLTSYSTQTTVTHGPLSTAREVPVSISTGSSELWTTEYDSSSITTVGISPVGRFSGSVMDSTFVDSTQMGITTQVPFSAYDSVSELLTASVSVTETDIETSAAVRMSYSADGITATSDKYTLSSSSVRDPFNVPVSVTELPHKQYDTITFTDSPIVTTISEILPSYSAGTEAPVFSMRSSDATYYAVKSEPDVSTDVTSVYVAANKSVYTSTNADIISQSVTPGDDVTSSIGTQIVVSISSQHGDENLSTAPTSTTMDSVPGDFTV